MKDLRFWRTRGWRCIGCDEYKDVWAIPIGRNHFDIQLCRSCRRELVRRILQVDVTTRTPLSTAKP